MQQQLIKSVCVLQPLIKWPWGKYTEFNYIKNLIPQYDRYVEPFFWWWGVFFRLQPEKWIINDVSSELMNLYSFVKERNIKFGSSLREYVHNREKIPKYLDVFMAKLIERYWKYKSDIISDKELASNIHQIMQKNEGLFNGLFSESFAIDNENLLRQITKNIISKLKRTKFLEWEKGDLPLWDLEKNIETAFRSWFYMHFRDIMNFAKKYWISKEKETANYYFIREFCYACMFRYNDQWHFNIPYGWIAYNNKDFRKKVDYLLSADVAESFQGIEIRNEDFENILNNNVIKETDFVFLDPPYDTEFDDYHGNVFTKKDQERLANCLYTLNGKFLLIIKKTDFIYNLYANKPNIKIDSFEKKYLVNIKWRNDQNVEHLIVYNY